MAEPAEPPVAPLVHICGWAGSGKATIGRVLAQRIGGRLLDNHLMIDPASALFARGSAEHTRLRAELRHLLYDAAAGLPAEVPLVLTDALSDTPSDAALFAPTLALARRRGADVLAVTLEIDLDENLRRLQDPGRKGGFKLVDGGVLKDLRAGYSLLRPKGALRVDVTSLSAQAAAHLIQTKLSLTGARP